MPDPISPNKPGDKKELPMEARLIIAFVLMFLVLFSTQYFYKPGAPAPTGPNQVTPQKAEQLTQLPEPPKPTVEAAPPAEAPAAPAAVQASAEEDVVFETALFRVVLSNRGAVVKSWTLKRYLDSDGKPLELVNAASLGKVAPPLSIEFKDRGPNFDPNTVLYAVQRAEDGLGLDFEHSDGQTLVRKSLRFRNDSYLAQVLSEVLAPGAALPHYLVWRGGFGDPSVHNAPSVQRTVYFSTQENSLESNDASDAKDGPVTVSGDFTFAGIEDPYFTAVFLPSGSGTTELRTFSDSLPYGAPDKIERFVGAAVGGHGVNRFSMFVGPKDTDILKAVDPKLDKLIDWGWFGFLAKPLFYALHWTNDRVTGNWGWAIVLVTVAINMLTLPLRLTSMKSAKKMQALQPQIQAINEKYKGLPLRDPRQGEKNQAVMDLYKKHGVNPLGGCLPMVLQMPFFFAFYTVLTVAIELRGADWLWVGDLSRPETLPIRMLPILMIATQFLMQKMMPASPGMDPTQQKMMLIMPLALGFMFYYQSSGLVLYWLTGNVVGIAQQWATNKLMPTPVVAEVKVVPKSAPKKKTVRT
jgi:YidC/Oxa1 family membrane protein insertase